MQKVPFLASVFLNYCGVHGTFLACREEDEEGREGGGGRRLLFRKVGKNEGGKERKGKEASCKKGERERNWSNNNGRGEGRKEGIMQLLNAYRTLLQFGAGVPYTLSHFSFFWQEEKKNREEEEVAKRHHVTRRHGTEEGGGGEEEEEEEEEEGPYRKSNLGLRRLPFYKKASKKLR